MDSLKNPVGPQPAAVYWRRRGAVVAIALVVLVVLVVLWPFGGGSSPASAPADAGATPTASPSPTAASAAPSPSPSPTLASPTINAAECADDDLAITTTVATSEGPVGEPVTLEMAIANTSDTPCARDVGPVANEFVITSGGFRVWSSDDCNPGGPSQLELLPAGRSFVVTATWPTILTSTGCPSPQQPAQPGSYDVTGANGSVVGTTASLTLTSEP